MTDRSPRFYDKQNDELTSDVNNESSKTERESDAIINAWPDDDIQAKLDTAGSSTGVRAVRLVGDGPFTVGSTLSVPTGVTLEMEANPEDGAYALQPSGDFDVIHVPVGGNPARVRNLMVDTTNVSGYSSRAIKVQGNGRGGAGEPVVHGVTIHGTSGEGTLLQVKTEDGEGLSWQKFQARLYGGQTSLELVADSTNSHAFTNANVFDLQFWDGVEWIKENRVNGGSVYNNHYYVRGNGNSSTEGIAGGPCSGHLETLVYDWGSFNSGDYLLHFDGNRTSHKEHIAPTSARYHSKIEDFSGHYYDMRHWKTHEWQGAKIPEWLTEQGDGTVEVITSGVQPRLKVGTSGASGDVIAAAPPGATFQYSYRDNPHLSVVPKTFSGSNVKHRFGIRHPDENYTNEIVYDPTDSLGTGITANWFHRVIDPSDSSETVTDTGVSDLSNSDVDVYLSKDGTVARANVDGSEVASVDTGRLQYTQPFIEVESFQSAAKSFQVYPRLEAGWVETA